jgi:hypothetical protein
MNEQKEQKDDWSAWFSTYGLLTAQRILERFNVHLAHAELVNSIHDPHSVYFQLLRVPLKNVFNGIILQQAHDYQIYAQKLFVDYLLSGEDGKEESSPGAVVREDLEITREKLIEMDGEFREQERTHRILIAESQATLITISQNLRQLLDKVSINPHFLNEELAEFIERSETMNLNLRNYRSQFYNIVLRITELLALLPDYRVDDVKINENRESLQFDALIGE